MTFHYPSKPKYDVSLDPYPDDLPSETDFLDDDACIECGSSANPCECRPEPCPATAEAVVEREDMGEVGCPLCGRTSLYHQNETPR
jgi:hypothetical protein